MGYFVTGQEIIKKKKDFSTLLALTLCLGVLGAHRFYLQRYLSGWVILVAVFLTAGHALWVVIPLVLIEFIKFAAVHNKMVAQLKSGTKVRRMSIPNDSKAVTSLESVLTSREVKEAVPIFDISNIETSLMSPQGHISSNIPSGGVWARKLELPYERSDLAIPQLRKAVYVVFEKLAGNLDRQLRDEGGSLNALLREAQREIGGYNNVLYTLFCIAEGEVTKHYSHGYHGYDNTFSYTLITKRLGGAYTESLRQYVKGLVKLLPPANDAIRQRYDLMESGLPSVWWDKDGVLRASHKLSDTHIKILKNTPARTTKLYDVAEVRVAIFTHYFKALAVLSRQRRTAEGWSLRMSAYLDQVFDSDVEWVANPYNVKVLSHILKLSEHAVGSKVSYPRSLDVSKDLASIWQTLPKDAAIAVLGLIDAAIPLSLTEASMTQLGIKKKSSVVTDKKPKEPTREIRRRVVLDTKKLSEAHEEHQRAVKSVIEYLGDEGVQIDSKADAIELPLVDVSTVDMKDSQTLQDHQKEFIRRILDSSNSLDVALAEQFAKEQKKMLNGYIQSINKVLFGIFEDQVIIQQDGRIKIEEYYLPNTKELL